MLKRKDYTMKSKGKNEVKTTNDNYIYGERIKELRVQMGLTQNEVAKEMNVTPGYIINVEKGRTSMSLRMLIYYAKLMDISLDSLVGRIDQDYESSALDRDIIAELSKMNDDYKKKLLKTIKLWNK